MSGSVLFKTEAIVLRWSPFSETSRTVSWLTPNHGRIAALLKGALRPRSVFLGQYDLFQTCELVCYARQPDGLAIARECCPLKPRPRLALDWQACGTASYLAGLVARLTPEAAAHPELYTLLDALFDELDADGATPALLFWSELRLLDTLGLAPQLQRCQTCQRPAGPRHAPYGLAVARGGIVCPACRPTAKGEILSLTPDVLALLSAWQRARTSRNARTTRCTAVQERDAAHVLGRFLAHHLDLPLTGRDAVLDLLARRLPA